MPTAVAIKISDSTKNNLRNCRINDTKLHIDLALNPKDYKDLNRVLEELGGKWNRGQKCHIFSESPVARIDEILKGKILIDETKTFQYYPTPPALAAYLVELAEVSGCRVLEPSAGQGNLVKEILAQGAKSVVAIEINTDCILPLGRVGGDKSEITNCDFLEWKNSEKFDRIVANPPFSKNQWLHHLFHSYSFLKDGGVLVTILPNSRQNAKLQKFLKDKDYKSFDVEEGAFKEEGTLVNTCILKIYK